MSRPRGHKMCWSQTEGLRNKAHGTKHTCTYCCSQYKRTDAEKSSKRANDAEEEVQRQHPYTVCKLCYVVFASGYQDRRGRTTPCRVFGQHLALNTEHGMALVSRGALRSLVPSDCRRKEENRTTRRTIPQMPDGPCLTQTSIHTHYRSLACFLFRPTLACAQKITNKRDAGVRYGVVSPKTASTHRCSTAGE